MIDEKKVRRENQRWYLLLSLNNAVPYGAFEEALLSIVQALYSDATQQEVRRELDYLAGRELVVIVKQPDGRWHGKLTRYGVDVVEYTVDVEPGIARPAKYF